MKKAIGIIYIVFGIVGILSLIAAISYLIFIFTYISLVSNYPLWAIFDTRFVDPEIAIFMFYMFFIYGSIFFISFITSIISIILGILAMSKKISNNAVAIGAIIYGAITGSITILVLGIVFMIQLSDENKLEKQQLTTTCTCCNANKEA